MMMMTNLFQSLKNIYLCFLQQHTISTSLDKIHRLQASMKYTMQQQ